MAMTPAEKQRAYRERLQLRALGKLPTTPVPCNIPADRRWKALRGQARTALDTIREEMQTYYDDRLEEWQESDRGQEFAERLEAITAILEDLDAIE